MSERRVLTYHVRETHLDYKTARAQSNEARRLGNTLTCLARSSLAYERDNNADLHVAHEYGDHVVEWVKSNPHVSSKFAFDQLIRLVRDDLELTLNSKVQQRIGVMVAQAFKSYFGLCKSKRKAGLPGYKDQYDTLEFTIQAISKRGLKRGWVTPTGWSEGFELPVHVAVSDVLSARLKFKHQRFILEVVYTVPENLPERERGLIAGMDLGVNNLVTVAYSDGSQGFNVNGRPLKSMNAYANKLIARERSKLDKNKHTRKEVKRNRRLNWLWGKRERKLDHYLHSVSKQVVSELSEAGVSELVIGWNENIKQSMNMGKQGNQRFAYIPFKKLIQQLQYKARAAGIKVTLTEESYTSQASSIHNDPLPTYPNKPQQSFNGKRTTRGTYTTHNNLTINADTNAAYNIIRKVTQQNLGTGCVAHPVRLVISTGPTNTES